MEIEHRALVIVVEGLHSLSSHPFASLADSLPHHREVEAFHFEAVCKAEQISREVVAEHETVIRVNPAFTSLVHITDVSRLHCNSIRHRTGRTFCFILEETVSLISIVRIHRITFHKDCGHIGTVDLPSSLDVYDLIPAVGHIP